MGKRGRPDSDVEQYWGRHVASHGQFANLLIGDRTDRAAARTGEIGAAISEEGDVLDLERGSARALDANRIAAVLHSSTLSGVRLGRRASLRSLKMPIVHRWCNRLPYQGAPAAPGIRSIAAEGIAA